MGSSRERSCKKTHNTRFLEKKRTILKRLERLYERGIRERVANGTSGASDIFDRSRSDDYAR